MKITASIALSLVLVVAAGLLGSCKKVVYYKDPNELLPRSWPVPQLTLPKDVELKREPAAMHELDPSHQGREWVAAFDYDGNWQGLISHVEDCLRPLDYYRRKTNPTECAGVTMGDSRVYYSPDYLTEVYVSNGVGFPGLIEVKDVEFAIKITVYEKPPEHLQVFLNLKRTRPKMADEIIDGAMEKIP